MPTATTAAVAALTFAALYAGHQIGDHVVQTSTSAAAKGAPTADRLAAGAHPWTGWPACLRHVTTYTFVQMVALGLAALVAPLGLPGVVAALAVSASTHAVIDRRWLVRLLIRVKGCESWPDGPYLLDQSLHAGALLVAAVLGAAVTSTGGAGAAVAAGTGLVGAALLAERRLAMVLPVASRR